MKQLMKVNMPMVDCWPSLCPEAETALDSLLSSGWEREKDLAFVIWREREKDVAFVMHVAFVAVSVCVYLLWLSMCMLF